MNKRLGILAAIIIVINAALYGGAALLWNFSAGNTTVSVSEIPSPLTAKDTLVNLNTASFDELKSLDGIADVIAQRIIDYRKQNGGFQSIEELMEVRGIGEKIFAKNRDKITI